VEVVRQAWASALVIPRHSVRFGTDGAAVLRKGETKATPVRLASCTPLDCVVESGLEEGDDVALP
jgi:hypothetical protein